MPRPNQLKIDPTVDVGIVCALELEMVPLVRRLSRRLKTIASGFTVERGVISGRRVAVVRSDAGRNRLVAAADSLLSVHRPKWLIAAGFAVGIGDGMKRGDLIVASELIGDSDERKKTAVELMVANKLFQDVKTDGVISIAKVPRSAREKRALFVKTGAVAADQHAWSLAKLSAEAGVRFLATLVLVDDASGDAEPESRAVFHPSASYRAGGVVGAFMSGSGRVGKIWKIRAAAKRHAERLAEFLVRLVPTLP